MIYLSQIFFHQDLIVSLRRYLRIKLDEPFPTMNRVGGVEVAVLYRNVIWKLGIFICIILNNYKVIIIGNYWKLL